MKAHTSDRMLRESARLFAERGFHGTSIEDIGAACGTSGPAIYKHFSSKRAILATMLLDISRQLFEGGRQVVDEADDAPSALKGLIDFHTDFAVNEPDLIRVQDRDLGSLDMAESRRVRRLQRDYVELWVAVLRELEPALSMELGRVRAHAVFGLLNSTPHSGTGATARTELNRMAQRVLALGPDVSRSPKNGPPGKPVN
jgi:AcrR family transcriptional regulator